MPRLAPLLALLLATAAAGADTRFTHQGRLLDAVGAPVDGPATVTLTLYDHATAGTARWSDDFSLDVADGYYAVAVGPDAALDAALDSYPDLWV